MLGFFIVVGLLVALGAIMCLIWRRGVSSYPLIDKCRNCAHWNTQYMEGNKAYCLEIRRVTSPNWYCRNYRVRIEEHQGYTREQVIEYGLSCNFCKYHMDSYRCPEWGNCIAGYAFMKCYEPNDYMLEKLKG